MMLLNEVSKILYNNNNFVLLTHQSPDGDTLGSAYALCRALQMIGKNAKVLCSDIIPQKYDYIYNCVDDCEFEELFIVSVDVADTQLLGDKLSLYKDKIDLCIDHHGSNTNYAKKSFIDSEASATAEIIVDLIKEMNIKIDCKIAECIYTGLSTDTGCFKYANAKPKTYRIAADMIEIGARSSYINKLMFDTKTKERIELEKMVLNTLDFTCNDKCAYIYVTKEMLKNSGASDDDADGLAAIPRKVQGVRVGITIKEKDNNIFKVSLRTDGILSASEICKQFGGGGHSAAAGCVINGNLKSVKSKIFEAVCKEINNERNNSN